MADRQYTISPLRPQDIEKYRALRLQGLEHHPESFGESAAHFRSVPSEQLVSRLLSAERRGGCILVAHDSNGQFVGTVGLGVSEAEKMSHRAMLWGMYVDPRVRGAGLGRRLGEECLAHAKKSPCLEFVTLAVVTSNEAAVGLYTALGFRVYGTDRAVMKVNDRYFDEYLMVRSLRDDAQIAPR